MTASSSDHGQSKNCGLCGADCSDRPRVRDGSGQYYCRPCADRAKRASEADQVLLDTALGNSSHDTGGVHRRVRPQEAALRMVCLSTLIRRSFPEAAMASPGNGMPAQNADSAAVHQLIHELIDWMRREGVWKALSNEEQALMQQELGTWSVATRARVPWRAEALKMLAWSLDLVEEPGVYDEPADVDALLVELPGPETLTPKAVDTTRPLLDSAKLRSRQELRRGWSTAKLWQWRVRLEVPKRAGKGDRLPDGAAPGQVDRLIRRAVEKATADELFRSIHDDFPAFGRPLGRLDDKQFSTVRRIAAQRYHAMNWVCGRTTDWDALPITI